MNQGAASRRRRRRCPAAFFEVIEMREELCPACQGDGYVTVARDYYSASYGYYPQDEQPVACRVGSESGYMEVEASFEKAA